ncbi:MAG: RIP metalloprotease RseP [Leptothrix sp. (in: b-proteobacteria)]
MITVLAFLLTLGVLIVVHEWGHYRVARACDVKVLRFSIGFGRTLWRRQRGETEWVLGMLPLGGYVKMLDEREGVVAPHELHRAFNRKSVGQRAAIVAAGPLANLLLAVLLYTASYLIGTDEPRAVLSAPSVGTLAARAGLASGDWVRAFATDEQDWEDVASLSDLRWHVTRAVLAGRDMRLAVTDAQGHGRRELLLPLASLEVSDVDAEVMQHIGIGAPYAEPVLGQLVAAGPAERAGLKQGDRVLSVDGRPIADAAMLRALIRASGTEHEPAVQHWQVRRGAELLELPVTPRRIVGTRPSAAASLVQDLRSWLGLDEQGAADAPLHFGRIDAVVGGNVQIDRVSFGPIDALQRAAVRTWDTGWLSLRMLGRMLTGQASLKNLSGPLTIADYAGQSVQLGLAYYLGFLAVVSISLGMLNLLPLPVLDGGHLLYYLVEAVMRRPIPDIWIERLQRGGLAIILVMMSLALYNDVARLIGLH